MLGGSEENRKQLCSTAREPALITSQRVEEGRHFGGDREMLDCEIGRTSSKVRTSKKRVKILGLKEASGDDSNFKIVPLNEDVPGELLSQRHPIFLVPKKSKTEDKFSTL